MHLEEKRYPSPVWGLTGSHRVPLEGDILGQRGNPISKNASKIADINPELRFPFAIPSKQSLDEGRNKFVILLLLFFTAFMSLPLFLLRDGSQTSPSPFSNSSVAQYIFLSFANVHIRNSRTFQHLPLYSNYEKFLRSFGIYHKCSLCRGPILKYHFCKDITQPALVSFNLAKLHRKLLRKTNNTMPFSYRKKLKEIRDLKYHYFPPHLKFNPRKVVASIPYPDIIIHPLNHESSKSSKVESFRTVIGFFNQRKIIMGSHQKVGDIKELNFYQRKRKRKLKCFLYSKETYTTNRKVSFQFPYQSWNAFMPPVSEALDYHYSRKDRDKHKDPNQIQDSMPISPLGWESLGMKESSSGGRVKFPQPYGKVNSKITVISTEMVRMKRSLHALVTFPGREIYFSGGNRWDWDISSMSGKEKERKSLMASYEGHSLLEGGSENSLEREFSLLEDDQKSSENPFQDAVWEWYPANKRDWKKQRISTPQGQQGEPKKILVPHIERSTALEKQPSEYDSFGLKRYLQINGMKYISVYSRKENAKWSDILSNGSINAKSWKEIKYLSNIKKTPRSSFKSQAFSSNILKNEEKPIFMLLGVGISRGVSSPEPLKEEENPPNTTHVMRKTHHPPTGRKESEVKHLMKTKHENSMHIPREHKKKRTYMKYGVNRTPRDKRRESSYWENRDKENINSGGSVLPITRYKEPPDISQIIREIREKIFLGGRKFIVVKGEKDEIENTEKSKLKIKERQRKKVENEKYPGEEREDGEEGKEESGTLKKNGQQPITRSKRDLKEVYYKESTVKRLKRKIDIPSVSVIEGEEAALPCDLRSPDPDDAVQIILWIKEGLHTPLYSYDFRELLKGQPKETKPDANSTLSRRTSFRTDRSPAALVIERAEVEDEGVYRCRVDFLLSPTVNHRVNLTVIVPPNEIKITWYSNNSTLMRGRNNVVGPFLIGTRPTLICSNDDGWPPPSLIWLEDDQVIDDSFVVDQERSLVENQMTLDPLTRNDLGRRLTCLASNTNRTRPAVTSVSIELSLRILTVKVDEVGTLWANEKATVVCRIWGSRPPPSVLWWLGSRMLPPTGTETNEIHGNVTLSYLEFIPSSSDDGVMLICQATNEVLPQIAVQDSTIINVNYAPVASVTLGRSLDPWKIKEGDDVYLECSVVSKPPVTSVVWKHNGLQLLPGSGIILSNMSLVVQGVTRSHGGNYTCHATNSRNVTASPPLHLDVKYTPVCAVEQRQQHSVGKLENAEIACKVDANPRNVTFRWTFNNTAEAIDVPEGRFVVVGTESRVNYTPMNELDYGTLLCWANNSIGVQQYPCVFQIVAAGKPEPPHECKVSEVTISSFRISCLPGDDGGLYQKFLLQVSKVGSTSPVTELSRPNPSFNLNNLTPATSYRIVIAAINEKGASRLREVNAHTLKVPETLEERSAEPTRDRERGSNVPLALLIGIIVAVVPTGIASVVFVWLRVSRSRSNNRGRCSEAEEARGKGENDSDTHSSYGKGDPASTEVNLSELAILREERNPDILLQTFTETWRPQPMISVATISVPPYVVAEDSKRYPSVTLNSTANTTNGAIRYNQYCQSGNLLPLFPAIPCQPTTEADASHCDVPIAL